MQHVVIIFLKNIILKKHGENHAILKHDLIFGIKMLFYVDI